MSVATIEEVFLERDIKPSLKHLCKGKIVELVRDAIIFDDQIGAIRSTIMRANYEKSLISWKQAHSECSNNMDEFVIVDTWMDSTFGAMYLLEGEDGVFVTTRPNIIEVEYKEVTKILKEVRYIKNKKDIFIFNFEGHKTRVVREESDEFDIEKAVLYACLKMLEPNPFLTLTHKDVIEFIDLAKEAYASEDKRSDSCEKYDLDVSKKGNKTV